MARAIKESSKKRQPSSIEWAQAKLETALMMQKDAATCRRVKHYLTAGNLTDESNAILREVVGLLAGAVGLRVSAESVAKRPASRKRARRKATVAVAPAPVSTPAKPPKRGGLPVAEPWENKHLPEQQAQG